MVLAPSFLTIRCVVRTMEGLDTSSFCSRSRSTSLSRRARLGSFWIFGTEVKLSDLITDIGVLLVGTSGIVRPGSTLVHAERVLCALLRLVKRWRLQVRRRLAAPAKSQVIENAGFPRFPITM